MNSADFIKFTGLIKSLKIVLTFIFLNLIVITPSQTRLHSAECKKAVTHIPVYRGVYKGTAVVITGAAAKIPQEAALLERLHRSGALNDVAIITGASSGALNSVVLNAILKGRFSWKQYKKILFSVTNSQVFTSESNLLPANTKPLRSLVTKIVHGRLGYHKIGDLPFPTALSATNIKIIPLKERTFRFSNLKINEESNPNNNLVDILMASTAIPIVFPSVKLNFPDSNHPVTFIDGGVAEDVVPYKAVLEYEAYTGKKVKKMIIVSKKSGDDKDISSELNEMGIRDSKLFENLGISLQRFSKQGFINNLKNLQKNYPDLASRTYVYIPDFDEFFSIMNFNSMREQYKISSSWAAAHQPVPLAQYLAENQEIN